ncbi:heavy metal translocating P-type ATPase [Candidatus Poribacteria bacterium]|nr:heavy metal translocating P-type ATPase [Candidatus Poribacteria bacterium]
MQHENNNESSEKQNHNKANGKNHHAMMEKDFKKRFWICLIITVPVLFLSPTIQKWFNLQNLTFPGSDYVLFGLSSIIVIWGGIPFYKGAFKAIKDFNLDMMVLVSVAILSGYFFSIGATFFFQAVDFYWEISTLAVFLLFGHWMEMKSVRKAGGALEELAKLIPDTAHLVKDEDQIEDVSPDELEVDDIVLIRPAEKVPIDGKVTSGESSVDESMITGESKPINKTEGDELVGGTINGDGALRMKVSRTGEDTALGQIMDLVNQAQESKPKAQKLADRAAHWLTIIALTVGLGTFLTWYLGLDAEFVFALTLAITVIVITCPHALGLAIPTVTSISTTLAAKNGIMVKKPDALQQFLNVETIVFDKTGTLTKGNLAVQEVWSISDNEEELLSLAASLESNSEHIIARGIVTEAEERNIQYPQSEDFEAVPGKGAKGVVDGYKLVLGNAKLMDQENVDISQHKDKIDELTSSGNTVVMMAKDGEFLGAIALADQIRQESKVAVKGLKEADIQVIMLTGDNEKTASAIADELDLDDFFAEVLPEDKSSKIKDLQDEGHIVAMVGDGVNDAPALAQADIGIAIGAGTDVAVESAEIVLVKDNPKDIINLKIFSEATRSKMKQNIVWATGYNAVAIPVAAGVLRPIGVTLRPEWAALIMAASSIIVVINALLLKRTQRKVV